MKILGRFTTNNQTVVSLLSRTHLVMGTFLLLLYFFIVNVLIHGVQCLALASGNPSHVTGDAQSYTERGSKGQGLFCILQDYVIYTSSVCKYHFTLSYFHYPGRWLWTTVAFDRTAIIVRSVAADQFLHGVFFIQMFFHFVTVVILSCPGNSFSHTDMTVMWYWPLNWIKF